MYALGDNLFKEHEERAKFFDFVITVIPVLSPHNVRQIISAQLKEQNNQEMPLLLIILLFKLKT